MLPILFIRQQGKRAYTGLRQGGRVGGFSPLLPTSL